MNWLKKSWPLILILGLALALRLFNLSSNLTFLEDEGRDLLIVKRMLDTGKPVLLGPQTSTGNMYLGPLYYYLITPALVLSHLDPVGPAVFIVVSGLLTTYLLFLLGKKWFSTQAGYLAALLFAVLPFSVAATRASWNPNLVPLVATLMLLIYDRLAFGKPGFKHWLLYGVLVGTMVQLHYMALVFCGVLSLSIAWAQRRSWQQLFRGVLISLVGAAIVLSPFIFFEYRNDWVNTRALTRFMLAKEEHNIRYDPPLWLWWRKVSQASYRLVGDTLVGSEMGTQPAAPYLVIAYFVLLLISLWSSFKKHQKIYLNLGLIFLSSLAILGIYQESIQMHYLEFGIPLILLLIAGMFGRSTPKWSIAISWLLIAGVIFFGPARTLAYINSGATHQIEKARAVTAYIVSQSQNQPYNLVSSPKTNTSPYQYFAFISSHPPSNVAQSLVFMICQDKACSSEDINSPLIFIHGPSHPSIVEYIGHPLSAYVVEKRRVISNQHVSYGIWVAEIVLE